LEVECSALESQATSLIWVLQFTESRKFLRRTAVDLGSFVSQAVQLLTQLSRIGERLRSGFTGAVADGIGWVDGSRAEIV
jgi:hypothetical protein